MTTQLREYRHDDVDRSTWGPGAWQNEPDKIQWVDEATGLDCLMHRSHSGAWCGYVGVAEGHPYFGVGYSQCTLTPPCGESYCDHQPNVDVHGGLTYADFCQETTDEAKGICHVPFDGRPHRVFWFGFDCLHCDDLAPANIAWNREHGFTHRGEIYRDRPYVEGQVRSLASQLAALYTDASRESPGS